MASATTMSTATHMEVKRETKRSEKDDSYRRELLSLFREIRLQSANGIEYFRHRRKDVNGGRFFDAFSRLHDHTNPGIEPSVDYLMNVAHLYDFDQSVPGNGYRSIVIVIQRCSIRILSLSRYIACNRDSFLFRGDHYSRELEAHVTVFGQLRACVYYLQKLVAYCPQGVLFPDEDTVSAGDMKIAEQLMGEVESLCQESFYGRCLGFQFCDSMVRPLTTINLVMASFSDGYPHSSRMLQLASSVFGSHKYILDAELRAQRVVEVTRNGDVEFCKAFWSLAETQLMHKVPLFVCPSVAVDRVIILPPDMFEMPLADGSKTVTINPPCSHSGPGAVYTRLICYQHRVGQEDADGRRQGNARFPMSDALVIHCHGGGFVAQSSASHEVYLRHWAKDLDVPILCVDYSLAPEYPFPRQLEETFYAYCWALKNSHLLGSTAKHICIVGDSAGGNLAVATALKAVAFGVRVPDGILSIYGSLLIKYIPSPSRILAVMDPLLPLGILPRCLGAYAGSTSSQKSNEGFFKFPSVSGETKGLRSDSVRLSELQKSADIYASEDEAPGSIDSSKDPSKTANGPVSVNGTGRIEDNECGATEGEISKTGASETMCDGYATHRNLGSIDSGFLELTNKDSWSARAEEKLPASTPVPSHCQLPDLHPNQQPTYSADEDTDQKPKTSCPAASDSLPDEAQPDVESRRQPGKRPRAELHLSLNSARRRKPSTSLGKSTSSPTFVTPVETPSSILSFVSAGSTPQSSCFANSSPFCTPTYAKMRHFAQSPVRQFRPLLVDRNPFMSPLYASDDDLRALCPVYLLTCHMDPMLDDSVMFAKRLASVGKKVRFDILDGLPHGFLNFTLVSQDAKRGSEMCICRLKEILCLESVV